MLFENKNHTNFIAPLLLVKKKKTSNGSQQSFYFKNKLPLLIKLKSLMLRYGYRSGRNNTGQVVINSKKSQKINFNKPKINYDFRSMYLSFIANFVFIPKQNKLASLLILSSGLITFVQSSSTHELFKLTRFKSFLQRYWSFKNYDNIVSPLLLFQYNFFTIGLLVKNKPISLIEPLPKYGIIYVRSAGSSASILKMNSITSTALLRLPSGVKKIFSTYSLASNGKVHLPEKNKYKHNKAGFHKALGKKSKVRGVAKNPIDHPHGGRSKAIKYQRTP